MIFGTYIFRVLRDKLLSGNIQTQFSKWHYPNAIDTVSKTEVVRINKRKSKRLYIAHQPFIKLTEANICNYVATVPKGKATDRKVRVCVPSCNQISND